ncbi:hypothetical protein BDV59DRAFT_194740 [Aspergillus ambiguus]|uniref:uncharacterized protein n=1 Tax=Aspergillus ambiguus TaxID=176160 RepID=UPI003CCDB8F4
MATSTIDGAMAEALGHLNRVASHFRKHGQHDSANELGKLSIMIVNAFSEGLDHIPTSAYIMDDEVSSLPPQPSSMAESQGPRQDECHASASTPTSVSPTVQRQTVAALLNGAEREREKESRLCPVGPVQTMSSSHDHLQPPEPGSWAQVAVAGRSLLPSDTAQYMSPLSMGSMPVSKPSQNGEDDEGDDHRAVGFPTGGYPASLAPEIPEAKAGIIRIYGRISKDIIQFITTRIHEGPLQEIRPETNGRTRVTFQHASHALAFLKSNHEMEQMLGFGRFGCGYHVELAEIVDWNDDHRRMNQPIRERRRLSFARKRLFAENMSPEKWKQDVRSVAGPGNIDFLWVFNSGNATAVFTSTLVARKVLEAFNRWREGRNVYSGVSVTYSSDPCEKELVLVKESARPNIAKNFLKRSMR